MVADKQRRSLGRHGDCTIARGGEIRDRGSIFTAQCAWPVSSAEAASAAIATMRSNAVCASADHNITAYRIVDAKSRVLKGYDDDGEAHGGQRLLGCLTKLKAVGVAVVVSRVYGGQNLGKVRFEHICTAAQELLEALGHQPGAGIRHDWGSGHALGGSPAPLAAGAGADVGAARKRKGCAATAAAEEQAVAAKRAM
eukprot:CAMPEP_0119091394 /NCGR_PEP_ID=MMETSP1178-20130426/156130_1 /TAXON_ID=33656 /ORGANISM="unid sp, Strain CCMP2000" /LENGTH=196 /DNA_ID=CAMNT_0007074899 /DNA_START=26 /DNA_END=613 /DNA_ORIENTATION=+